ncbi:MAG: MoaD/ThiS family protein [Thalassolituus sp.]
MIRILFFAKIKDEIGKDFFDIKAEPPMTVSEVRNSLISEFSDHENILKSGYALCAVNQQISNEDTAIQSGDEVAFFPPVTGG